jgi:hypothetical protein
MIKLHHPICEDLRSVGNSMKVNVTTGLGGHLKTTVVFGQISFFALLYSVKIIFSYICFP